MNGLLGFAGKLQANRYLNAIKNGFTNTMPVVIVGSFCVLIANMVCNTTPGYLSVANIPGMAWLEVLKPMFTAANYGTMNFLAITVCISVATELAEGYGFKDKAIPALVVGCFISLCDTTATVAANGETVLEAQTVSNVVASKYTAASGLFVAMFVAIAAVELYIRLIRSGKLEIKMPDSVPYNVAHSFSVLFPAAVTLFAVSGFGLAFKLLTGMTLFDAIVKFIQTPLSGILTHPLGIIALMFCINFLWLFGIHGSQTLQAIYNASFLEKFAENEAAYLNGTEIPNIVCSPFMSVFGTTTGCGMTGGLLIAILLFSKRDDYRTIAKLAVPCGIFNINEPVVFGIPIVLNPIFMIPFLATPMVSVAFGYFMTSIGFCGKMVVNAPWTTPPLLLPFLASGGNFGAVVTQAITLVLAVLIYTPFVIAANKMEN